MRLKRILAVATLLLTLVLIAGTVGPVISNGANLPGEYAEAIQSQSKGLYSKKLPLVSIWTSVTGYEKGTAFYTIHYFPFGTVEMSYHAGEGYNIEKPLTRW